MAHLTPLSYCDSKMQGIFLDKAMKSNAPTDFLIAYVTIGDRKLLHRCVFIDRTDVNAKTKDGTAALHVAARVGNHHVVQWFLEETEAFINVRNSAGSTPLHEACKGGHFKTVKVLAEFGADFQIRRNLDRMTPYDVAAYYGHIRICTWLEGFRVNVSKMPKVVQEKQATPRPETS